MRQFLLLITFLSVTTFCNVQNDDSIYAFMNKGLPDLEIGKSQWGIFFLDSPYIIDSSICNKILQADWSEKDIALRNEFYTRCKALNTSWQKQFRWNKSKLYKTIVVSDTRHRITASTVADLALANLKKTEIQHWIKEWNKSKPEERLVNYSSIPVFDSTEKYVLIIRGQDSGSEGGWDTIYIYEKIQQEWIIYKRIVLTSI